MYSVQSQHIREKDLFLLSLISRFPKSYIWPSQGLCGALLHSLLSLQSSRDTTLAEVCFDFCVVGEESRSAARMEEEDLAARWPASSRTVCQESCSYLP